MMILLLLLLYINIILLYICVYIFFTPRLTGYAMRPV